MKPLRLNERIIGRNIVEDGDMFDAAARKSSIELEIEKIKSQIAAEAGEAKLNLTGMWNFILQLAVAIAGTCMANVSNWSPF